MATDEVVFDEVPSGCDRKTDRTTKTVGQVKEFLLKHAKCRLRNPIYKINVKYFDTKHPLLINYLNGWQNWCEYVGNVHAVCLYQIFDQANEDDLTRELFDCLRTRRVNFKDPIPVHMGEPAIENAYDLWLALNSFSDDMFLSVVHIKSDMSITNTVTLYDLSTSPDYYDGFGHSFIYSEDKQLIIGWYIGDHREKIELETAWLTGWQGDHVVVYTNVDKEFKKERIEYRKRMRLNPF